MLNLSLILFINHNCITSFKTKNSVKIFKLICRIIRWYVTHSMEILLKPVFCNQCRSNRINENNLFIKQLVLLNSEHCLCFISCVMLTQNIQLFIHFFSFLNDVKAHI